MLGHGIGERLHRQIAHVRGIQRPHQASPHTLGHQRATAVLEGLDLGGELTHGRRVLRRHCGKAIGIDHGIRTIHELHEALNDIVHVDQVSDA
jgi:hypothetical protein